MIQQSAQITLEERTRTQPYSFKAVQSVHFLHKRTPFIIKTECTFLISTHIKWNSPTCYGTCALYSGRTQFQSEPLWQCLTGSNTRHITNKGIVVHTAERNVHYIATLREVSTDKHNMNNFYRVYIYIYIHDISSGDKIEKNKIGGVCRAYRERRGI